MYLITFVLHFQLIQPVRNGRMTTARGECDREVQGRLVEAYRSHLVKIIYKE